MEIGGVASPSYASPQSEGRSATPALQVTVRVEREALASVRAPQPDSRASNQASQERSSAVRPEPVRQEPVRQEQPVQTSDGGSVRFETDEGTRVMKVMDSKDVLIYQVPPKGALTLIQQAEADAARQVLTSA